MGLEEAARDLEPLTLMAVQRLEGVAALLVQGAEMHAGHFPDAIAAAAAGRILVRQPETIPDVEPPTGSAVKLHEVTVGPFFNGTRGGLILPLRAESNLRLFDRDIFSLQSQPAVARRQDGLGFSENQDSAARLRQPMLRVQ